MEQTLNYNFFNTLIFSGIIYGFVFCGIVLSDKEYYSNARNFLILTVFSMTFSNMQYWLIDLGLREKYDIPKVFYIQCELLILPFFYLFVQKYLRKEVTRNNIILVLMPFVLGMMYQLITFFLGIERESLLAYNFIAEIITIGYSLFLVVLIVRSIILFEKNSKGLRNEIQIRTKWLKVAIIAAFVICLLWIASTKLFYVEGNRTFQAYYPLWIGISVLIYWIGNKGVVELRIVKDREAIRKEKKRIKPKEFFAKRKSTNKGEILFSKIKEELNKEQLYLLPDLSLQFIADKYNISSGYLSQLMSMYSNDSFTDYINKMRINEAKEMLVDISYSKYKIDAIALESGFNTKSNFYAVFKKEVNMTPKQYKRVQNM